MTRLFAGILFAALLLGQNVDTTKLVSARSVTVTNSATADILCPLEGATLIQVYVRPTSTAQVYTITLEDSTTIEVPSGGSYTFTSPKNLKEGQRVFRAQTATSSVTMQVLGAKEVRQ